MKAWQIFTHSLRQITGNFGAALRVSALPYLFVALVTGLFVLIAVQLEQGRETPAGFAIGFILGFVVVIVATAIAAVNWHRHILLNEPVGWVPNIRRDRLQPYILTALGVGLLFTVIFGVVGLVGYMLGLVGLVVAVPLFLLATAISFRASTALPARALGVNGGVSDAMAATAGATGTLVALSVIYILFSLLVGIVVGMFSLIPVVGVLADLAMNWFNTILGLSILTTLYGHYVEGRELV